MTSVNVTSQSNTVTVQQGDATTVTIATQGPQGPAGAGASDVVNDTSPQLGGDLESNTFDIKFADNDKALFGADSDLQIFHDSNHSFIKDDGTGQLKILTSTTSIKNTSDNQSSAIFIPASSCTFFHSGSKKAETTTTGFDVFNIIRCLGGTAPRIQFFGDVNGVDTTTRATFGLATGANQIVHGTTTNDVALNTPRKFFIGHASNEVMAKFDPDGPVELYHDNVKKAETTSDGLKVDATLAINSGSGTLMALRLQNDVTGTANTDGAAITYSTNSHGYFFSAYETNGNMIFQTGGSQMNNRTLLISQTGIVTLQRNQEPMLVATPNAGVELYHNNVKKAETSSDGFDAIGALRIPNDTGRIKLGASQDFQLYHGGTNSVINNNTGDLKISLTATDTIRLYQSDKSVGLFFNGSQKAETTSSGLTVTGTVTETSDIAFKSDVKPITNTLDKLQQITGYKYKLDNASIDSMGVIAQDVEKVFPELVHGDEGSKTLQYSGLIGVLVEAVKDLSAKVKALESN